MPTIRETGKDRWKRVPKNYFKKPDGLQRVKLRLSVLALALALAYCAWGMDWSKRAITSTDRLSLMANHGVLAKVHSAWDRKCEACHVTFEPIDGRPLLASTSTAASRTSDQLCMSCHAGPAHHAAVVGAEVRSCAECHRDHRGREASLVRLDDLECTRCHASLKTHTNSRAESPRSRFFADKITRFDFDHPDFLPEAATRAGDNKTLVDNGGLKFNHALHMTPGLVKKTGDTPYKVRNIPVVSERARYGTSEDEAVKLDCASCHVLEASEIKAGTGSPVASPGARGRGDGKYYQPVRFENQCRACHDLSFDPRTPEIRAPHGVQPEAVVAFLKQTYAGQMFDDNPRLFERFVPAQALPGKPAVAPEARNEFDRARRGAEKILFGDNRQSCHECHTSTKAEDGGVPGPIIPTRVPAIWFPHATFDHSAHRAVSCYDCHARSYALGPDGKPPMGGASQSSKDVLLPDIRNCKQCHTPARSEGGWLPWSASTTTGGVDHDCTECHTYHNGDHATQGRGASAEDATRERTIAQFLLGTGGEPPHPGTSRP